MSLLTNVRISTRLALGFVIVLALSIVSTSLALMSARNNAEATRQMMEKPLAKERLVSDLNALIYSAVARTSVIARSSDDTLPTTFADVIAESAKKATVAVKGVEELLTSDDEKALFKEISDLRSKYQSSKMAIMGLRKNGDAAGAERAFAETFMPVSQAYEGKVLDLLQLQRQSIDKTAAAIDQANQRSGVMIITLSVLLIALSALIAFIIARSITAPLKNAIHIAGRVAAGDLTTTIDISSQDEIGELMQALNRMNDALKKIVSQVKTGIFSIASAAGEIATGNLDLSARTEQQASSLEETAAAIEELTSTIKQNSENADQTNQLARTASEVAAKGGAVVSQVVETMGSINDSAKKIVDIIGVIDGIAFQTNILALNAAVEAARAGEQGRGFAVVAAEVRNLAQRSAAAAKEIKVLIGDSVDKVSVGAKLVDEAGATMNEVVASVKRVTDIVSEITAAGREQSAGIAQVNQAIISMDDATQQNAALVEQAAAAAQSMQDQAAALDLVVNTFKLDARDLPHAMAVKPGPTRVAPKKDTVALPSRTLAAVPAITRARPMAIAKTDDWEEF